jgi:non-heme chloroperoxidase
MPHVTVGQENSGPIEIYYEDHGAGRPVVLIHGWPQSSAAWEKQASFLLEAGYRVIAYDRRGFGRSARPATGYEYDTMSRDLDALLTRLDLHDVSLVGFSMGGGEVARYLHTYGSSRVCAAVFVSAIPPFLLKQPDNPGGVDGSVFDGILAGVAGDRPAFLAGFLQNFFNVDVLGGKLISEEAVRACWNVGVQASAIATYQCVKAWLTDFREDLPHVDVPTLIVHGDSDRIVPFEVSAKRTHEMIKGSELRVIEGAPHGLTWTHAAQFNAILLEFLEAHVRGPA